MHWLHARKLAKNDHNKNFHKKSVSIIIMIFVKSATLYFKVQFLLNFGICLDKLLICCFLVVSKVVKFRNWVGLGMWNMFMQNMA